MASVESESERTNRIAIERRSIIDELEKLKTDKNDARKLLLVISDENNTGTLGYNFDSVEQLILTLAIAQATWVELWGKLRKTNDKSI